MSVELVEFIVVERGVLDVIEFVLNIDCDVFTPNCLRSFLDGIASPDLLDALLERSFDLWRLSIYKGLILGLLLVE